MKSKQVTMITDGFHVILAKQFSTVAAAFESEIRVVWEGKNIISDGKSILGLMALELKRGMSVTLTAEGPDEDRAIERLSAIVEAGV